MGGCARLLDKLSSEEQAGLSVGGMGREDGITCTRACKLQGVGWRRRGLGGRGRLGRSCEEVQRLPAKGWTGLPMPSALGGHGDL